MIDYFCQLCQELSFLLPAAKDVERAHLLSDFIFMQYYLIVPKVVESEFFRRGRDVFAVATLVKDAKAKWCISFAPWCQRRLRAAGVGYSWQAAEQW